MAFTQGGGFNPALIQALQQRQPNQAAPPVIKTGPQRSQLIAQLLQARGQKAPPQIQSIGELLARLGGRFIETSQAKKAADVQLEQQESQQQALASALSKVGLPPGIAEIAQQNPELAVALAGQQQQSSRLAASAVSDRESAIASIAKEERQRAAAQETQARNISAQESRQERGIRASQEAAETALEGATKKATDLQEAKRTAAIKLEKPRAQARLTSSLSGLDSTSGLVSRISKHPGLSSATGISSAFPTRPGSDAANVEALLETLRARLSFAELAKMKAASPTGGALGAISERELSLLGAAEQSLSVSQSQEQFSENLNNIESSLARLKSAQQDAFDAQFGVIKQQDDLTGLPSGSTSIGGGRFRLPDGTIVERE